MDVARERGADVAVFGTVNKISTLILSMEIKVLSVETGKEVARGVADIRGDNDRAWLRGMQWLVQHRIAASVGKRRAEVIAARRLSRFPEGLIYCFVTAALGGRLRRTLPVPMVPWRCAGSELASSSALGVRIRGRHPGWSVPSQPWPRPRRTDTLPGQLAALSSPGFSAPLSAPMAPWRSCISVPVGLLC